MGELRLPDTNTTTPQRPRITIKQLLSLIGDQGKRSLLQHLGPGRTQRQQPDRCTELIGYPAVEVTLHHFSV